MYQTEGLTASNVGNTNVYKFDRGYTWFVLIAASLLFIFLLGITVANRQEALSSPGLLGADVVMLLVAVGIMAYSVRRSKRSLKINDDGVFLQDGRGNEISSIRWVELGRVSERRELGQLALWDKAGTRRVLVDQLFQNFTAIRSRILDEYAKVFTIEPLPIEFRNPYPLNYQSVLMAAIVAFFVWGSWSANRQNASGPSVILAFFAILGLVNLLKLYPGLRGPSVLFDDRLVLRSLFKTREIYKKEVASIDLNDRANQSGTRFSLIALKMGSGEQVKITFAYGSILEMYLTLRAWLAH
jgi:hypothetical protein